MQERDLFGSTSAPPEQTGGATFMERAGASIPRLEGETTSATMIGSVASVASREVRGPQRTSASGS